jgi:hypothetical protein
MQLRSGKFIENNFVFLTKPPRVSGSPFDEQE